MRLSFNDQSKWVGGGYCSHHGLASFTKRSSCIKREIFAFFCFKVVGLVEKALHEHLGGHHGLEVVTGG
jgi:hypothetical protein